MPDPRLVLGGVMAAALVLPAAYRRWQLSRAKHPSLQGHARWARRLARLVPYYDYDERRFYDSDDAPAELAARRRAAFERLANRLTAGAAQTSAALDGLHASLSDLRFTTRYRVPFQYSKHVAAQLKPGTMLERSRGVLVRDLDGRESFDLTGSYGVNLFGYDFYKECIRAGMATVQDLGPVLGAYHPVVLENVRRLQAISGLDEVSFHMSGTEAVMQAVRLARFHTRRTHLVRFCGSYHGWWDDVQPGVGTPVPVSHTYTLRDMDPRSLRVLESRSDIACVLVNPLQVLHPNSGAPADGTLVGSRAPSARDRHAYSTWLASLRDVCTRRGIVLIFDEVFVGFRIARGGAQEYFGVRADLATYGKTLGGGLPVGALCGSSRYMRRFHDDRPSDVCFARGTFNSHPYVMGAMHQFLTRLERPEVGAAYERLDEIWDARAAALNERLAREGLPVSVANLVSIWTVHYHRPSRYNWMFQFYLRAEGLALSWVGTGRLIFSHDYTDAEVAAVIERFTAAARAMREDGWWWHPPGTTDRAITRRILREMMAARVMARPTADHAASSLTIGSKSSPRST